MAYEHQTPIDSPFCFIGSADKIADDKAMMSEFRKQHGMDSDPYGPIIGTPQEVDRKLALLKAFKRTL